MWHEARKQEKKIRGMLVDYRKRAERRQDFYERIKADPTQFLQVHSRKCKIHLDASVATAAENPAIMMPWQGQKDNLIDRFDVRAHLDYIPPVPRTDPEQAEQQEDDPDERGMNYERYRVLAQNEFLGIVEEKYLHQLYLEEQFGVNAQVEAETKAAAAASKKKSSAGAAIGYTYEETETVAGGSGLCAPGVGTTPAVPFAQSITAIEKSSEPSSAVVAGPAGSSAARFDECMKDESDSDLDMDVSIDINKIGNAQAHELNTCGRQYGMKSNDFYSFLTKDSDEADALRMAREEEQEKIMFSGRKSRRERRAQRERKFAGRPLSPPSYAAKEELVPRTFVEANDSSRSPSPVNSGKITYITSFGGEDELHSHSKISFGFSRDMTTLGGIAGSSKASRMRAGITGGVEGVGGGLSYADKVKQNLEKLKAQESKESDRQPPMQYQRTAAMGRSRRGSRSSRSSRSSSSSRGPRRSRGRRRSSSSSRSRSRSRARSRARSKNPTSTCPRRRPRGRTGAFRSRSRSRSVGAGGRGGKEVATRQPYSRYRKGRSKSKSRSRTRSRSRSRTRGGPRGTSRRRTSPGYSSRRRRSSARSSTSSSSSSTSSSRSRSRSSSHRPVAQSKRTKRTASGSAASGSDSSCASKNNRGQPSVSQEKLAQQLPHVIISTLPPLPPPPPPPPPLATVSGETAADLVEEKKPIATLAILEPEPEVPIKRYYGRRRGDESSSDELGTSGEDTNDGERKTLDVPVVESTVGEETGTGSSKISSAVESGTVQIKQEKPDTGIYGLSVASPAQPTAQDGAGPSLRFGKTVTGGTSAPESKVGIIVANSTATSGQGGSAAATAAAVAVAAMPSSKSVNPRDRLKRKMQILLNKQYKADKKAEIEKVERQIQQQQERDDEMRELALKLRRRQRELRHKYGTPESEHSKSHSSEDRSSDEGGDGGPRFGHPPAAREASASPQRPALLSAPVLTSVPPPKMPLHTSRPPPSLLASGGGIGYGNTAVIERKPILRSASDSGVQPVQFPSAVVSQGGDMGRLRRRNSPAVTGPGGTASARGFTGAAVGMSSSPMTLRRGGAMTGARPPPSTSTGGRFDDRDRNRRRTPPPVSRYNRSRSKSRERFPSRDTGQQSGSGGYRGRRMDYGRSRDYDRYHGHGGDGPGQQSGFGGSSGRYRGRRSRSGSRGRRSRSGGRRSGSPVRTRGNGGAGSSGGHPGNQPIRQRERASPKPVKKLVDY